MIADLTLVFVQVDDFCKSIEESLSHQLIGNKWNSSLSVSEVITILITFNLSDYRHFKHFYLEHVGWFFGFKLHLIVNDRGEMLACHFSPGNTDDRKPVKNMTKNLFGYLFGDKGYISQELFEDLYNGGIKLVTKIKSNMKNALIPTFEKLMLRKRAIIESVNDFLKNICQIEHTRHRSPANAFTHMLASLAAYSFIPKKPSLNLSGLPSIQN